MLAGITRILERQSEHSGKSHEEDVAERCCKQGPKEFAGTTDPLVAEEQLISWRSAKRRRLDKVERRRCRSYSVQSQEIQAQRIEEGTKFSSRGDKSAAKQLTNYQRWMSTAELISNGESDSSLQKKRTQVLFLCRRSYSVQSQEIQAQRIEEGTKCSSRGDKSAAKQLTNYRWMSTAELNSNGESDKKPAKEKDTSTVPLPDVFLYRTGFSLDELSGCASLGQMPSFYFRCAVRSFGARLNDKYMGRDRRMKKSELFSVLVFHNFKQLSSTCYLEYLYALICLNGFSLDELSGCASLGQMPSFYFRCAVRSFGARLNDKYMGRDRRMKNLSCSLYWFFIILSNSVARVIWNICML
ncbi:TMV resistance protein N-like [Dorcoceras hygrometricum]|uniref:TMV resistance protein N-like n=1 Tax=Dorcoceras hygrometricum TaxID=472368 RepID=A0A2Z7AUY8_9LAMI|nr:TMV resistance protein N-like [Dorcoceras hygrometricum]